MRWTKLLVFLVAIALVVWSIGALVTLFIQFGTAGHATAVLVVFGLLVVAVGGMVSLGAKGPGWLRNPPHYW